jgi:hypothetical protein
MVEVSPVSCITRCFLAGELENSGSAVNEVTRFTSEPGRAGT